MDFATARRSALSQLRARLNSEPELVAAFWMEVASPDRIASPDLTVLYCTLTHNRKTYTILEFVCGETLEELVKRSDPADCETAIPLFCRVLDAFEDADKKPLQRTPGVRTFSDSGATLTDFGLCRAQCAVAGKCHGTIVVTPDGVSREEIVRENGLLRAEALPLVASAYRCITGESIESADLASGKLDDVFLAPLSKRVVRPPEVILPEPEPKLASAEPPAVRQRAFPPWAIAVGTSLAVLAGLFGAAGLVSRFGGTSSTMTLPQFPPIQIEAAAETPAPVPSEPAQPIEPITVNASARNAQKKPEARPQTVTPMAVAAKPAAAEPTGSEGLTRGARLLSSPSLSYPPKAKTQGVSGVVRVEVTIDQDGTVSQQRVLSGHPLLRAGVVDAMKHWVYQPALLNGKPVPMTTEIEIKFNLDKRQ